MNMNPYTPELARITDIRNESDDGLLKTFTVQLDNNDDAKKFNYLPGQFAEISVLGTGEAPFGMASSPTEHNGLKFTVQKTGSVTSALHRLSRGSMLGIRGPLGHPFPFERMKGSSLVLIGGGFGITTLRSLLVYVLHPANRQEFGDLHLIYGARRPGLLLFREELEHIGETNDVEVHLTIDIDQQNWDGHTGLVPDVLREVSPSCADAWALVCGPPIMIDKTVPVLTDLGFDESRILCSLERKMKCGIGHCGRCNIGPKYVCKDGPVFSVADLKLLPQET